MKKEDIKKVLLEACLTGADYAELYIEDTTDSTIKVLDGKVDDMSTANLYGAAIRLLRGMEETYGYTNDVTLDGLMSLAKRLSKFFNYPRVISDFDFKESEIVPNTVISKLSIDDSCDLKIKYLLEANAAASTYSPLIVQATSMVTEHVQHVTVANTLGALEHDVRNNMRYSTSVVAQNENGKQSGHHNYGGNFGLDAYKDYDFKEMGVIAAKQAITMLNAPQVKGGVYDVVIHNAFGGVIFHEACGHALEASSVARGLSVFSGKLGQKIANECVTAIDDGTIPNEWGSLNVDDEGNKTNKNVLIENGILKSYMVDYKNSRLMNHPTTGSGRRQSYRYIPTSRMTNTYIANGKYSPEEIIANTKKGIFAYSLGGGSVNPATGEYNFAVNEGYLIEDGKITTPIRGATLIGNGAETLLNIDMVGNNQTFGYGMCGSSSGSIPACVGQPTIRVKNMTVGGNGE